MQKMTAFLWYDTQAEKAMLLYTSIFKDSKRGKMTKYGEGSPKPAGRHIGDIQTLIVASQTL